jgi:hypothetical protein
LGEWKNYHLRLNLKFYKRKRKRRSLIDGRLERCGRKGWRVIAGVNRPENGNPEISEPLLLVLIRRSLGGVGLKTIAQQQQQQQQQQN